MVLRVASIVPTPKEKVLPSVSIAFDYLTAGLTLRESQHRDRRAPPQSLAFLYIFIGPVLWGLPCKPGCHQIEFCRFQETIQARRGATQEVIPTLTDQSADKELAYREEMSKLGLDMEK